MEQYVLFLILGILAVVLGVAIKRKRMEIFINFALRLAAGAVGIYLLNTILVMASIQTLVGFNMTNVLVVGVLGLPGFAMLYGLGFYFTL